MTVIAAAGVHHQPPRPLLPPAGALDFDFDAHRYTLGDRELTSVTTILDLVGKDALPWWGMTVGLGGLLQLIDLEGIQVVDHPVDRLTALLTIHKLTVNHVRDKAGKRGTVAHKQLERYGKDGTPLNLGEADEAARGYVRGAARLVIEERPRILATEVMVWSEQHGFAGTFDALVEKDGRLGLWDYKTSKRVYDSHHLQLGAYEGARRDLGLRPIDFAQVVLLTPDGDYELTDVDFGEDTFEEFLAIKGAYDALQNRKARLKAARKNQSTT